MSIIRGSDWMQRANTFVDAADARLDALELADTGLDGRITALEGAAVVRGAYTADADDATAGSLTIDTGEAAAAGLLVSITRAGAVVTADAIISMAAGVITVTDGAATYDITAGDVVTWLVF